MDIKTFEYMESRVNKAKILIEKIEVLTKTIDLINENECLRELSVDTPNGSRDLIRRYDGAKDSPKEGTGEELYNIIRPVLLNAFIDKRKKLQEELQEI